MCKINTHNEYYNARRVHNDPRDVTAKAALSAGLVAKAALTAASVSRRRRATQFICRGCVEQTTRLSGNCRACQAGVCQHTQGVSELAYTFYLPDDLWHGFMTLTFLCLSATSRMLTARCRLGCAVAGLEAALCARLRQDCTMHLALALTKVTWHFRLLGYLRIWTCRTHLWHGPQI